MLTAKHSGMFVLSPSSRYVWDIIAKYRVIFNLTAELQSKFSDDCIFHPLIAS